MMVDPALCPCGTWRSIPHRCEYQQGRGHCRRCLAEYGDPACCTPARLARIVRTRAKPCGCLVGDDCGCGAWVNPPAEAPVVSVPLGVGTASYGPGRRWSR